MTILLQKIHERQLKESALRSEIERLKLETAKLLANKVSLPFQSYFISSLVWSPIVNITPCLLQSDAAGRRGGRGAVCVEKHNFS